MFGKRYSSAHRKRKQTRFLPRVEPLETRALMDGNPIQLAPIGVLPLADGAEISAYDAASQRLFLTGDSLHIVDMADPQNPIEVGTAAIGDTTSVAVRDGLVAAAVPASPKTDPGKIVFLDTDGTVLKEVTVGALPDMITFTPEGSKLLVANEGEPDGAVDPLGSVSIIDLSGGVANATVTTADFTAFDGHENELRNQGVRIFPGKNVSRDVEPEYIAVAPDGKTAFVTLQEANAFGVLDLATGKIKEILPLGLKDHSAGPAVLEQFGLTELPDLGTTATGEVIKLGGLSGLWYDGMTASGNYKFLTLADRGPNADPTPTGERPFLLPEYQARAVELELNPATGQVAITNQILLTRADGTTPISGLPNIPGVDEIPVDALGNPLSYDPFGADLEGIVRAPDGTLWMCDEYRPSIYHFDAAGKLLARYVPQGTGDLGGQPAGAYGIETLPAEYSKRVANRGFEGIAYDTDKNLVYAFIQSPLANPDAATSNASSVLRMLGVDPGTGEPATEYVYLLEAPAVRTSKVDKIGDAVYAGDGKFVVIERDSGTTPESKKFVFEIDLKGATNLLDSSRYDPYFLTKIGSSEPATDSASAGTAIATGYKTDDGNLAWLPGDPNTGGRGDGGLTTIAEALRAENGFSIGVVSTVPFSHATPAAFVSHNKSRNNYNAIASEIIHTVQPEVVIGGGNRGWGGNYLSAADQTALEAGATAYTYVGRQTGTDGGDRLLAAAAGVDVNAGGKLFGLFGGAGGSFEYHVAADTPGAPSITQGSQENPTLPETVQASLDVLSDDPQGFFVMFEQGDIDWANHANDFENMIGGVWDLDQAVRAAEDAVAAGMGGMDWSNTLMIVTSDHSNSYLRLRETLGAGDLPAQSGTSYPGGEVTYGTGNHTNELVTVAARGQGSDLFAQYAGTWYPGTQIVDNTQLYHIMKRAAQEAGASHVMLFIGDGMNIEHEIAGSRYLYGQDNALAWHDWGLQPDGWAGFCSTWDVTTYNKYASTLGKPNYSVSDFDPQVGYDPDLGGIAPYPLVKTGNTISYTTSGLDMPLTAKTLEQHTADQLAALNIKPVAKTKVLNLPSIGYLPNDKPEGLALLPDGRLAVLNDNDFALGGPVPISLGVISFAAGNTLDASDRDGPAINLANWPVYGTYMPDAVASFASGGQTFYITANEGDDRGENARVKDLKLDAGVFPNATDLKKDAQIGRLNVSKNEGDLDGDGDYDQLWAYGARSFSIWDAYGNLVFDSGDQLEAITAAQTPALFNADNGNPADFDTRSDNKGPEPEAVTIGVIDGRTYAFVGIERSGGGVFVYDVTNPQAPQFIQYVRMDGDVGPESLSFIAADSSPNGRPLLVVANEVSHTATIYEIDDPAPVVRAEGRFGGNLTIRRQNYTSGGRDFADLQVIDSRTGAVLLDQPLAATQSLHVIGTNLRADLFTVDFAFGGNFVLPDGLHFDSGTWRRASDAVRIQGTAGDDLFSLQGPTGQFNGLDVMLGDVASVTLEGGAGDDIYRFHSSSADVTVQDTAGVDLLDFSPAEGGVRIDLRRSTGAPQRMPWRNSLALRGTIEAVIGSEFADWIMGNTADNRIWGRGGNDAIFGNDGNDWVWGGDGDDSLYGDRGQDVLLGEAGNDYISGGHDRDLLIGGTGSDRLYGGWDDDLLVAGTTAHDGDDQALAAIMAEWATPTPAATRVGHLQAGVGPAGAVKLVRGETVFDDGDPDWLWGESGDDWYLLFTGDAAIGRGPGDL